MPGVWPVIFVFSSDLLNLVFRQATFLVSSMFFSSKSFILAETARSSRRRLFFWAMLQPFCNSVHLTTSTPCHTACFALSLFFRLQTARWTSANTLPSDMASFLHIIWFVACNLDFSFCISHYSLLFLTRSLYLLALSLAFSFDLFSDLFWAFESFSFFGGILKCKYRIYVLNTNYAWCCSNNW